jgi:hypothetical protein
MSKRARAGGGAPAPQFTSFQPKKFRPQRTVSKAATNLPDAEKILEKEVPAKEEPLLASTDAIKLDSVPAVRLAPEAGSSRTLAPTARRAPSGGSSAVLHASVIPDDATYKTELEIMSNFDASAIARPEDHFRSGSSAETGREEAILRTLLRRWAEAQVTWCHPHPYSRRNVVPSRGFSRAEGSSSEAGAADSEAALAELVESVLSVSQLFLEGKIDTFLLYTPGESTNRASISANFLMDVVDPSSGSGGEGGAAHCCVVTSVNTAMMRRLQARGAVFQVLVPYPYLIDSMYGELNSTHSQTERAAGPPLAYASGVCLHTLSPRMLYKIRVAERGSVGAGSIAAVVDEVLSFSLAQVAAEGGMGIRSGKCAPLQIVSTKPFAHASVCEAALALVRIVHGLDATKSTNQLSAESRITTLNTDNTKNEGGGTSCRIVLRGYFTADAVQALASVMAALSMCAWAEKSNKGYGAVVRLGGGDDAMHDDAEFRDAVCSDPSFLQQRKRSRGGADRPAAAALKDPMQLTVSKRGAGLASRETSSSSSSSSPEDTSAPVFSITAREHVGVSFLSRVSGAQKERLAAPAGSSLHQGFILQELSWAYSAASTTGTQNVSVKDQRGGRGAFMNQADLVLKYRIMLTKNAVDHAVPVALLGTEREALLKKEGEVDESVTLDPFNAYSVYAN